MELSYLFKLKDMLLGLALTVIKLMERATAKYPLTMMNVT
jgi:hypothetical protein